MTVPGECVAAIDDHRRQLMQDLSISPEIVKFCHTDLNKHCQTGNKLHCLMNVSINKALKRPSVCPYFRLLNSCSAISNRIELKFLVNFPCIPKAQDL